jgi:hypothetical protein
MHQRYTFLAGDLGGEWQQVSRRSDPTHSPATSLPFKSVVRAISQGCISLSPGFNLSEALRQS